MFQDSFSFQSFSLPSVWSVSVSFNVCFLRVCILVMSSCYLAFKIISLEQRLTTLGSIQELTQQEWVHNLSEKEKRAGLGSAWFSMWDKLKAPKFGCHLDKSRQTRLDSAHTHISFVKGLHMSTCRVQHYESDTTRIFIFILIHPRCLWKHLNIFWGHWEVHLCPQSVWLS